MSENEEVENSNVVKEIVEWILCIVIAVVLALLVRHFVFTPTVVKQVSMVPTLQNGDRLFLNRLSITLHKEIKRGEIITFEAPSEKKLIASNYDKDNPIAIYDNEPKNLFSKFAYYVLEISKNSYIKRVIGIAGDHILIEDGKVYLNGEELHEDYLPEGLRTDRDGLVYDFTVPEGCIFAMGDNRGSSMDCRSFGCIPIEKVESKVLCRFWPMKKI